MRHCHSCAIAHLNSVFCTATPIVKNPYKVIFDKSSSLCKTDTVRYVVLHPKLVKGSFSRLIQFTSCFGQPSLTLLLGYCTNWGIAITTVTFRRYGRVPLKTGAPILSFKPFHFGYCLSNSADPDVMPHIWRHFISDCIVC